MNEELREAVMECCRIFEMFLPVDILAEFANLPEKDISLCHFTLGLYLRNNVLYPGGKLFDLFITNGITEKDDMSSHILKMWHKLSRDKNQEMLQSSNNDNLLGTNSLKVEKETGRKYND